MSDDNACQSSQSALLSKACSLPALEAVQSTKSLVESKRKCEEVADTAREAGSGAAPAKVLGNFSVQAFVPAAEAKGATTEAAELAIRAGVVEGAPASARPRPGAAGRTRKEALGFHSREAVLPKATLTPELLKEGVEVQLDRKYKVTKSFTIVHRDALSCVVELTDDDEQKVIFKSAKKGHLHLVEKNVYDHINRNPHQFVTHYISEGKMGSWNYFLLPHYSQSAVEWAKNLNKSHLEHEVKSMVAQLIKAYATLHSMNRVIHCDCKPDNICFSFGVPKIIDFGGSVILPHGTNSIARTSAHPTTTKGFSPVDTEITEKFDVFSLSKTIKVLLAVAGITPDWVNEICNKMGELDITSRLSMEDAHKLVTETVA